MNVFDIFVLEVKQFESWVEHFLKNIIILNLRWE